MKPIAHQLSDGGVLGINSMPNHPARSIYEFRSAAGRFNMRGIRLSHCLVGR